PAIANFFPRCWDPVHNTAGRTNTINPYKGDFFLDGNGTLPTGQPNLRSVIPNHMQVVAVANPLEYHNLSTGVSPANLHDRGAGYGIVRFHKSSRTVTLEAWPIHVDPEFPQTGSQFPDWPFTFAQHHNDGRTPTGFLQTLDTGWVSDPVVKLYDESTGQLVYAVRARGNRFRPPVYDNNKTYRIELADPSNATLPDLTPQPPAPTSINSFRALNPAITTAATSTLQWDTSAPATLTIDHGIGDVSLLTIHGIGQIDVSPTTDTTYTLTLDGNLTATTTVRVYPTKPAWLNTHFTPAEQSDPEISGDDADPDRDRLTNADEFLYQTDPKSPTATAPSASVVDAGGQRFAEFELPTPVVQLTPAPVVETSTNLRTWTPAPANTATEVSRDITPRDGTPRLRFRVIRPLPENAPETFYRAYWITP
ncbi:MAG: hypothetical protein P8J87_05825, partial [Verrucomicrobiales bacterium]|nr:hypothetical protein [Verrucomicrobiales bacterium]